VSSTTDPGHDTGEAPGEPGADSAEVVDGRSSRWDRHRAQRRQELVEATLRAIRARGAGVGIDDIDVIDLYSCFPSAVQLGARSLGLSLDRQLTRTGGLSFNGGPWNNYVMHAIATMMNDLRERPGEMGLIWGNGGYATKHSFGIYSTTPPAAGFRHAHPQDEIDALPRRTGASAEDAAGAATIEAYTVLHDRDGQPEKVFASCLIPDGRRAWASSDDRDTAAALCDGEWVAREVTLSPAGHLHP
jgi:acetyl-CoA C-acetyltransferase